MGVVGEGINEFAGYGYFKDQFFIKGIGN